MTKSEVSRLSKCHSIMTPKNHHAETIMPPSTNATATPLWKRMLFRRLKFLAWLVGLLVIVLGGSYLFAPQWLMQANFTREAMAAHLDKHSVQAGDTRWSYY